MKNIHDFLLTLALLGLSICQTNAQGWEQTYITSGEYFGRFVERFDGGYTAMIFSPNSIGDVPDVALVATEEIGGVLWIANPSPGILGQQIHLTSDGGYYVVGVEAIDFAANSRLGLYRADADGELIWEQLHLINADFFSHWPTASLLLPSGEMLVTGTLNPSISGENDRTFLFKADADGNELWTQQYLQTDYRDFYVSLTVADNGDYLLAGYRAFDSQELKFVLVRTDADGNVISTSVGNKFFNVGRATQLTDGNLLFAGADSIEQGNFPLILNKTDQDGNVIWEKNIPMADMGLTVDGYAYPGDISATADGGAVLIFRRESFSSIVKLDVAGEVEWFRLFGDAQNLDVPLISVKQTADGGYLAAGGWVENSTTQAYLVKLDENGALYDNQITGKIYSDDDEDCEPGTGEAGAADRIVKVESANFTWYATSDADGNYALDVPTATLDVSLVAHPYVSSCPASTQVIFAAAGETATVDFGLQDTLLCPLLDVSIASWRMRACFEANYFGTVCNIGTATAEGATLEIELDEWLNYLSASLPLLSQNGQTLVFDLGDLEAGECTSFTIDYLLDCDAPEGITHCTEAHAFPDSLCLPIDPVWDGSSIVVSGECVDEDSIRFTILNVGDDMQEASEFIVIEDHMIQFDSPFQLEMDEGLTYATVATGSTFRLEAEQCPGHPGHSQPSVTVEGCGLGQGLTISTGIVNQYPQDDADYWLDIDCRQNTNSYDPNDKQASPAGALTQHYLHPNTDLEYFIRFQNTGTDTAINVAIRDTLSPHLDPGSIRPGAASHPYGFELLGQGVVVFTFPDIMLPDSNVNEPLSNGFVSFRISQQPDLPDGTVIENSAAIFFDFNAPIITNQTWHTVQRDFLLLTSVEPGPLGHLPQVKIYPNPVVETAFFEMESIDNEEVTLRIFDQTGRQVHTVSSASEPIELRRGELPAGLYFFKMETANGVLGSGKFVVAR